MRGVDDDTGGPGSGGRDIIRPPPLLPPIMLLPLVVAGIVNVSDDDCDAGSTPQPRAAQRARAACHDEAVSERM
jgi:hypothetical protein